MKKRDVKTISFVIFLVAITLMSFLLYPLFRNFESLATLDKNVESYGIRGIFILFTVQVFQVVAALIPGEVIEFASGLLYGSVGGFLICMAGLLVGEFFIFKMVSVWGQNLVELVLDKKSIKKLSFLKNERKVKKIIFLLYFIPGTPKDLLTYFAPLTGIKLKEFLIISLFARIPSVLSSTIAGAQLTEGNIRNMIIIYVCIAIFSIIGTLIYDKVIKKDKNNG